MFCTGCGSEIIVSDNGLPRFCKQCGAPLATGNAPVNNSQLMPVGYPAPAGFYSKPNLIISYNSAHPRVLLVVRIVSTGEKKLFYPGETAAYTLRPGTQAIILKIGKRNYRRDVLIPANGDPLVIRASWSGGVARIEMVNAVPSYTTPGFG